MNNLGINTHANTVHRLATCIADKAMSASRSLYSVRSGPVPQRIYPTLSVMLWKEFTTRLDSPEDIFIMVRSTAGWKGVVELTYKDEQNTPNKRGVYRVRHIEGTNAPVRSFLTKLGACVVHLINGPILERYYLAKYKWQLKQWGAKAMAHPRGARAQANMRNTMREISKLLA
jgi:hypothetical protein